MMHMQKLNRFTFTIRVAALLLLAAAVTGEMAAEPTQINCQPS